MIHLDIEFHEPVEELSMGYAELHEGTSEYLDPNRINQAKELINMRQKVVLSFSDRLEAF